MVYYSKKRKTRSRYLRRYRKRYSTYKLLFYITVFFVLLMLLGSIVSLAVFAWYSKDLPAPSRLSQKMNYSTTFYDKNGKVLYELYKDKNRIPVKLKNVSKYLREGTIAIEDKNFYKHKGVSERGIMRAIFNIIFRHSLQGGSTITQQLIKNVLLSSERTLPRKIKEVILATEVERRYSKDEILEMYLNEAPYGGSYWGVASASKGYFDKDPKDLTLLESAVLAGLPQSPSYYSPFIGKKDAWKTRAKNVLRRMREDGYITRKQEKDAVKSMDKLVFKKQKYNIKAPHFVFYVKDLLEKELGKSVLERGVKVKTTLDLKVQEASQKIVKKEIENIKQYHVGNGAAVVIDSKTGDILAMVGSYDFDNDKYGKYNVATALRQPGSSVKPITYAVAFEKGYTPATVLMDTKTNFAPDDNSKPYIPGNYDGKFRGPVQVRFALGNSINIPAVKMLAMVGIKSFLTQANNMGLTTLAPTDKNLQRFGLAITLGGGEVRLLDLTSAYSVFARGGVYKKTRAIIEVTDYKGHKIYAQKEDRGKSVLSKATSFLISHILSDNNARVAEFGPNSYLRIPGKTVAVKTGTTNDKRDNWAVGFTKSITVGVWVGNNDNSKMNEKIASGLTGASPIWHNIMTYLLSQKEFEDGIIEKPKNVKALTIDAYLGGLPHDGYPTRSEYFADGTEPQDISPFYKKIKISKATGKLANEYEIKTGNYDEKEFIVFHEEDPVSRDGKNRWQEGIDAWVKEQKDPKLHPPTEVSDAENKDIMVDIKSPKNKQKIDGNRVRIKAKAISVSDVEKIEVYIDGTKIKSFDNTRDIDFELDLDNGSYELKILARNKEGKSSTSTIHFGVNEDWKPADTPTPTPENTSTPTPTTEETPTPTNTPTPTPTNPPTPT